MARSIRSPGRRHRITSRGIDHANIQEKEIPETLPSGLIRTQLRFAGSTTERDGKRAPRVTYCSRWTLRPKMSAHCTRILEVDALKIEGRARRITARQNGKRRREAYPGMPTWRSVHAATGCHVFPTAGLILLAYASVHSPSMFNAAVAPTCAHCLLKLGTQHRFVIRSAHRSVSAAPGERPQPSRWPLVRFGAIGPEPHSLFHHNSDSASCAHRRVETTLGDGPARRRHEPMV
jgi:hypothetical protein